MDISKKSYQKLSKINAMGGKNSHLTPQKNFVHMGSTSNHRLERQGKQQLLPALNHNKDLSLGIAGNHHSAHSTHSAHSSLLLNNPSNRNNSATQQNPAMQQAQPLKKEKLLITGDDILIEYVARLMIAVKSIKENMLKA